MKRRSFVAVCTTATALAAHPRAFAAADATIVPHERVRLTDPQGVPLKSAALVPDLNYVFHYPFKSTPCLLLNLSVAVEASVQLATEKGDAYTWPGGVGPGRSVVAYSAICAHLLSHIDKQNAFISYLANAGDIAGKPNMISCCAHGAVYNPARGAAVVTGPPPQPLAAIALDHDPADDALYATGVIGSDRFHDFFKSFKRELRKEFGRTGYKEQVRDHAPVTPLSEYSQEIFKC